MNPPNTRALTDEIREQIVANLGKYPNKRAATLPALHIVHDALRHVSNQAIIEIAEILQLHPSEVHDTMSFYEFFKGEGERLGDRRVWICRSISCMLRGSEELLSDACKELHVKPGETTKDGKLTLEFAECLGGCEGAPCALIDDEQCFDFSMDKLRKLLQ